MCHVFESTERCAAGGESEVDWAISYRMSSADADAHTRAPKLITNSGKVENCASKESNHSSPHGWVAQAIYIFIKWRQQILYQLKLQYNHIESVQVWESVLCLCVLRVNQFAEEVLINYVAWWAYEIYEISTEITYRC